MNTVNYVFRSENIKGIPFNEYEKNFTFIVNGKYYRTSRFVADLISPLIRKYHYEDKTLDRFIINTNIYKHKHETTDLKKDDYFIDFLNLVTFEKVNINKDQYQHFSEYFLLLGNTSEYIRLENEYFENLTPKSIVNLLKIIYNKLSISDNTEISINSTFEDKFKKMIRYAASHFTEIDQNELKTLDSNIIEEIIKDESLQLDEEDSLLKFILDLYEKNPKYSFLFEYVFFENIKDETFEDFIDQFSFEDINSGIWRSICHRILSSEKVQIRPSQNRYKINDKIIEIEHKENEDFDGIMNYLNKQSGGNIHDNGTIKITSNSINSKDRHPKNLVNYHTDSLFHSKNEANVEVCFDFIDKKIKLNSYSIKSYLCGENTNHLKKWVVEVSNDGLKWKVVDRQDNNAQLNHANVTATFCVKETNQFYRFVRLRQTGLNWMNTNFMILNSLEFYGAIKIPEQNH